MGSLIPSKKVYVPESILVEILSKLPVKSLLRFKCIDKLWYYLISSQDFVFKHLKNYASSYILVNRYSERKDTHFLSLLSPAMNTNWSVMDVDIPSVNFKFERFTPTDIFRGTCNGIVCLQWGLNMIALWNPLIRDFKILPPSIIRPHGPSSTYTTVAFGYDAKANDYKILQVINAYEFELYSLSSDSWKKLEPFNFVGSCYWSRATSLSFENRNTFCWIAETMTLTCNIWEIISFDLSDEKFNIIQLPSYVATVPKSHTMRLFKFRDSIALVTISNSFFRQPQRIKYCDIWVSENLSNPDSWTKILTVRKIPMGFFGNDQIIFMGDDIQNVILYNICTTQNVEYSLGGCLVSATALEYKESLVAISNFQS